VEEYQQIRLHIPDDVKHLMEMRLILEEDLQRAIHHAEKTGEKFVSPTTGRFLTSHRPDRVTFWVEFSTHGEQFQIHTAYSHRMEMKRA
jgi:glutamate synthase (NADPH/NADH) small chain